MTRKKSTKKKLEIVFDPEKRKEFLTGFRKRKNERKSRAKADLERNLKEERKRIRLELKEGFKHLKKSFEPLRELTDQDKINEDEYEDDDVKVKIVELTTSALAAQRNLLGENCPDESDESAAEDNDDNDVNTQNTNCIPGMDFDINARQHNKKEEVDEEDAEQLQSKGGPKSKKERDRLMKTKTLKKLKKSKVFKMKERFDKTANQKKAKRDRNNTLKSLPKNQRKKKQFESSKYSKGRMLNKKQLRRKRSGDD